MASQAAARMRRMRERRKAATTANPIPFERTDWALFTDPHTLPQKSGCEPDQIGRVVLKELVDNALDTGATEIQLDGDERRCIITDNGPGIDLAELPRLFSLRGNRKDLRVPGDLCCLYHSKL